MKTNKVLLFAMLIFLCALCACGSENKTSKARGKSLIGVDYGELDAPIKIEIGKPNAKSDAIIKNGSTNVYRRSNIENMKTESTRNSAAVTAQPNPTTKTNSERAKKLSRVITDINSIDLATVVVSGHTAIIGIEHDSQTNDMSLMKLKAEIDSLVKSTDREIESVAVTANPELVKRVSEMSNSETSVKNETDSIEDFE